MCIYNYRLYGMRLLTDLEFPQLCRNGTGQTDLPEHETEKSGRPEDREEAPVREKTEDTGNTARIRRMSEAEQKRFGEAHGNSICNSRIGAAESSLSNATLQMTVLSGKEIRYHCRDGANPGYLRTYLLGFGMAMLALQQGKLPFHCSALRMPQGGAVLIAGESGAGKSTLTANLLKQGYRFLADDMAVADPEAMVVYPAFPYLKLCRDAVLRRGLLPEQLLKVEETKEKKDKFLVPYTGEFRPEGVGVKCFIFLGKSKENIPETETDGGMGGQKRVRVENVTGADSLLVYKENLFLRHLWKKQRPEAEVERKVWQMCLEMAKNVPVYYVERAAAGDSTAEVAAEVHRLLKTIDPRSVACRIS